MKHAKRKKKRKLILRSGIILQLVIVIIRSIFSFLNKLSVSQTGNLVASKNIGLQLPSGTGNLTTALIQNIEVEA